ncbi:non-ribosomal peptide synthetase, partial [Cupriavidus pauculus]
PESRVGIAAQRSVEMVVGLLAILKSGGAYVPLDPDYPPERLAYMIEDSGIGLLLTHGLAQDLPVPADVAVLPIAAVVDGPDHDPVVAIDPEHLAYVIYTSGSTGRPKGVPNRHVALWNRLAWMQSAYALTHDDVVLQKTPFSFDVSVWEFFWPLMEGARLAVCAPGAHREPARLAQAIARHRVSTLHFVPSMLQAFVGDPSAARCDTLRRIVCSGEALPADLQDRTLALLPHAALYNLYGPTEAAIDVTHWTCAADGRGTVPIGRPIDAIETHVLDAGLDFAPAGAAGELYLGGVGLARGYLGRPALTAERFVPHPFGNGERLYRTGDLARWGADMALEYLGRIDHQVKIRGLRIELGEIDACLLACDGVREAVTVAHDGKLASYVTAADGAVPDGAALRARLAAQLPDYMVPAVIVTLDALPLSPNGKLDRKRLPAPEFSASTAFEAPSGAAEVALAGVWQALLGVARVGRYDNFFELGGDSILSLQIVARARQAGWQITPRQLMATQNVAGLAAVAMPVEAGAPQAGPSESPAPAIVLTPAQQAALPVALDAVSAAYPVSPMQAGMLFHALYQPGHDAYVNQLRLDIDGLDAGRFAQAWHAVQARHDILRTGFVGDASGHAQWVASALPLPLREVDLRDAARDAVDTLAVAEREQGFDVTRAPLQRLVLARTGESQHHFIWTHHHLLLDGWSTSQLLAEVLRHYAGETLPAVAGQYRDYIDWLGRQDGAAAESFWRERLSSLATPTRLGGALAREVGAPHDGYAAHSVSRDAAATTRIATFARAQRVTVNTVVQAAWLLLLQRFTGQDTVAFGATVSGRPAELPGAQEWLGLFINTLPVIGRVPAAQPVGEWLRALQQQEAQGREFEHTPLYEIQRWAGAGGQGLFDTLLVFENYPVDAALKAGAPAGLAFGELAHHDETNYALTLGVTLGEVLRIRYGYQCAQFDAAAVARVAEALWSAVDALVADAQAPVGSLGLAGSPDRDRLLAWGRGETGHWQWSGPVHARIAAQARATPEAVAVICGGQTLRYGELDAQASALARQLVARGVGAEVRVGVALERTPQMIVALLAVLKAGGAYVPLDPAYPAARLVQMVEDSGLRLLLSENALHDRLAEVRAATPAAWLSLDAMPAEAPVAQALPDAEPEQLAYIIYTSGSTGRPKGVAVAHGPLAMHCAVTGRIYEMGPHSRELHFLSFAFDGAHERWLTALTHGASLVLRDADLWSPAQTADAMHAHAVTHAGFPPAYLQQLVQGMPGDGPAPRPTLVSFGGEAMPRAVFEQVRDVLQPEILINGYGPTETVVTPLVWKVSGAQPCTAPYAPVGRPVGERQAYVVDAEGELAPAGASGELWIGGEGLARGYLNRAAQTAERFVPDPFGAPGSRCYRTGDLTRWSAEGDVEYLGRIDQQVKIRGFRIELGEVEAALLDCAGVTEAAAVARDGRLLGYVAGTADPATLRAALAARLPDYMVPAALTVLPALPVTPAGKIDRKALPDPDGSASQDYAAPEGDVEAALAEIWQTVLGVACVGRHDNFFELGGDSILSLQIVARARELGWQLVPRQLFEHQTVALLAAVATPLAPASTPRVPTGRPVPVLDDRVRAALPVSVDAVQDLYPASPMQAGMLFHAVYEEDSSAYVNQLRLDIDGLEPERFVAAWRAVQRRHDILRTGFLSVPAAAPGSGADLLQWVAHDPELPVRVLDWRGRTAPDDALAALAQTELAQGFDVARPPLQRLVLVRTGSRRHHLVWTGHHLLLDGWSTARMLSEVLRHYAGETLPAVAGQYRDYIDWLGRQDGEAAESFWRERLSSLATPTRLGGALAREVGAPHDGYAAHSVSRDAAATTRIATFARAQRVTVNTVVQAAWLLLLQRFTGQDTVAFGATVSGRPAELPGAQEWLGLFINTLPVIGRVPAAQPVGEWLRALQQQEAQGREFEHTPLYEIQRWAGAGGQGLFDTLLVFENYPVDAALKAGAPAGLAFGELAHHDETNYALTLGVTLGEVLRIRYGYQCAQFDAAAVARVAEALWSAVDALVADAQAPVGSLGLAGSPDRDRLLAWGRGETGHWQWSGPVHARIAAQARATPEAVAVICGGQTLRYGELDAQASALARQLVARGVGAEVRVGVALERTPQMIVALLAVLKAGGAYVPLDPAYPAARLVQMVEDSGLQLLLTRQGLADRVPAAAGTLFVDEWPLPDGGAPWSEDEVHADQLLCVIFTSGSTGQPKGVALSHGVLAAHCDTVRNQYGVAPGTRVLHFSSFNFDWGVEQWLLPLSSGATVVLRGDVLWSAEEALAVLRDAAVDVAYFPTAYARQLAEWATREGVTLPARCINVAGEALGADALRQLQARLKPGARVVNGYGPTETVITPFLWAAHGGTRCATAYAPVGRPVGARHAYIVDAAGHLAVPGVAGELMIGGGLARGYLGRPGLTAERFVPDPLGAPGSRCYRTGDIVRWTAHGDAEYLGRTDNQVKIRGFRIELGEVEAQLRACPGVREAVVVVRAGRLAAYVTAVEGATLAASVLRRQLAEALPDYMVPTTVSVAEAWPMTPNGKIDRLALPDPDVGAGQDDEPPRPGVETVLAGIWCDVLGLERVGRHDNFFELGGDSILSLQIVARAREAGWQLTPRELFEAPSLAELASLATPAGQASTGHDRIDAGTVPLLPIQAAFLRTPVPARHHWNQSILLTSRTPVHVDALARALADLVAHHDSLRLRFTQGPEGWIQHYADAVDGTHGPDALLWQRQAGDLASLQAICAEVQCSLDLADGPLLRAAAIDMRDGSWRVLLVIHHLAVDGVSWRILLEDLQRCYLGYVTGQPAVLPARTASYQAWGRRLSRHAAVWEADDLAGYWTQLAATPAALPCDMPDGGNTVRHAEGCTVRLDATTTRRLLKQAPAAYRTQINDILLTALGRALCAWAGHDSVLVDLEGHGREDLFDDMDLSRTVGWFTSLYPVGLAPMGEPGAALCRVKEALRAVPARGVAHGYLREAELAGRANGRAPLPRAGVVFNYLGQFDGSFDSDDGWKPASEGAGPESDAEAPLSHDIAVNGQVYQGELALTFGFSGARYRVATIEALAERFRTELCALVDHCTSGASGATPSDFPLAALTQADVDTLPVRAHEIDDLYPLSPMQAGMLFHTVAAQQAGAAQGGSSAYVNQLCIDIDGLDAARFRAAWQAVQQRHDILRTGFLHGGAAPLQWVARAVTLPFRELDWRVHGADEAALANLAGEELARGFDIAVPPLQRLVLVRTGEARHRFIWTRHHLLLDGWSTSRLMGEVLRHYAGEALPATGGRYRDYIGWLQRQDPQAAERYWVAQAAALDTPTRLADAVGKPAVGATGADAGRDGYGETLAVFDAATTARWQAFAHRQRITLNTLVQGAWLLLLQRCTGHDTVAFGATMAGRPAGLPAVEHLLGLFINTLPVIQTPPAAQAVGDWLRGLMAHNLSLREFEHTPLNHVQRWAGKSGQPLFDSIIVFENYPVDRAMREENPGGLRFGDAASVDLTTFAMDLEVALTDTLRIKYTWMRSRFDAATVDRIRDAMAHVLDAMTADPARTLGQIGLQPMPDASVARAAAPWQGEPVHDTIRRLAALRPDAVAVVCDDTSITYAALQRRAEAMARRLRALGAGPDSLVAVATERSIDSIVAFLAVLNSAAAYVPLDPDYPRERLAYILADAGATLLLTQRRLAPVFAGMPGITPVLLDEAEGAAAQSVAATGAACVTGAPGAPVLPAQLAYLIYTSGSTGLPKGVAVEHGPLAMHCAATGELYEMDAASRELHFLSFAFDGAHERWLTTLTHGGTLVLRDASLWTPDQTWEAMRRHDVGNAGFPPAYLQQLAQWAQQAQDAGDTAAPALRLVSFGGEAMPEASFELVKRALRPGVLINGYGPTETVVTPLVWKVSADAHCEAPYAPIGRPVGQRTAYVLDAQMQPVPAGVPGELYIGGYGLARGYHGRTALTAERFIPDPFAADGGRLYRTGDVVRARADGVIEYVGRADQQVKIRGFRIEPGEVEACLRRHADVRDAVVLARQAPHGRQLVAYVATGAVARDGLAAQLKAHVAAQLPDYMVPAHVVALAALPVTPNGKIDRAALPEPVWQARETLAPRTPLEAQLAGIWREVLGVPQVGIDDNFFLLGGDSILSLQVLSRVRALNAPGLRLRLSDLMKHQTIAELAALAAHGQADDSAPAIIPAAVDLPATAPLTPIQQWFVERAERAVDPGRALRHYNLSILLRPRVALDATYLGQALQALVTHHVALRTAFIRHDDGRWEQVVQDAPVHGDTLLSVQDVDGAEGIAEACNAVQRSLDPQCGRLAQALLLHLPDGSTRLLLALHHLAVDGVSWRIVTQDLQAAYGQASADVPVVLAPAGSAYAEWAQRLPQHASSGRLRRELGYWREQLDGAPDAMPVDRPGGSMLTREGAFASVKLSPAATASLLRPVHGSGLPAGVRIDTLLLTALARALCQWTGQDSVRIELESHGREDLFAEIDHSRTVGWFTSEYPVRMAPGTGDLREAVARVQAQLDAVPARGVGHGVLKYLADATLREKLAALPPARVTFNYLGQFDQVLGEDGLFGLAPESGGDARDPDSPLDNWLVINAQVHAGVLSVDCSYSRAMFDAATVQALMAVMEQGLLALAEQGGMTAAAQPTEVR